MLFFQYFSRSKLLIFYEKGGVVGEWRKREREKERKRERGAEFHRVDKLIRVISPKNL